MYFFETLIGLRRILMQDLAYLYATNEDHWLLEIYPFNTSEFIKYAEDAKPIIKAYETNYKVNKLDSDGLDTIDDLISTKNNKIKHELTSSLVELINNLTYNNNLQTKKILKKFHNQSKPLNSLQKFTKKFVDTMAEFKENEQIIKTLFQIRM